MPMPLERNGSVIFRPNAMEQEKVNRKKREKEEYDRLRDTVAMQGEEIASLRSALFNLEVMLQELKDEKVNG